ncbi:MAG: hypothetical protein ABUL58_01050, partial [Steroidobacter sp.]
LLSDELLSLSIMIESLLFLEAPAVTGLLLPGTGACLLHALNITISNSRGKKYLMCLPLLINQLRSMDYRNP